MMELRALKLTLLLLFFELCTLQGHVISKREATDVDRYTVKSDKDTIEIVNPKAKKPTLREIIFYHIIEKPYPNNKQTSTIDNDEMISNDENLIVKDGDKVQNDFPRPWTNGHGFQYLNDNNLADNNAADSAGSSKNQESGENDLPLSDVRNDEILNDKKQNIIDDISEKQDSKHDQGNDKDLEEVKTNNDLVKVKNDDVPKEENERPVQNRRPVHIERPVNGDSKEDDERPVQNDDTDAYGDLLDDIELPKEDPLKNDKIADIEKIEDDKTIRFRDFITEGEKLEQTRRKRDIDYSKMHDAPSLPLFKMDRFPDYIKEILPSDDELEAPRKPEKPAYLSRTTEKPAYLSRSTEKSAYLSRTTEGSVYLTEKPEVARKPVYLSRTTEKPFTSRSTGKPENFMSQISIRIGDSEEHKITKKSARNVDEDIEKELSEVIRKVAEAQDMNTKVDNPSSGMNLIGDSGVVWNDLHGQHYRFNVGPEATNTEDHSAQIPFKPSTEKPEGTTEKDASTIDLSSEIESAIEEIGHIFEEILDQTDKEDAESEKVTTENYDIHVNINKDREKHDNFEENTKKLNEDEKEEQNFDKNKEIYNNDEEPPKNGHLKAKAAENEDDQDNLDQVMEFLQVIQKLVENSKRNESENEVKDKVIDRKESKKVNSESNEKLEKSSDTSDDIKDLLKNENYWKWLKDISESYMNIIMKRVLGLIKEEVAKQIQHLVFKMMEEQGISPPDEHNEQDKVSDGGNEHEDQKDEGNPKEKSLKADDKYWDWLKNSSEEYINILMKRFLGQIAEGVANQIDILATRMFKENGYTPPKKDKNNKIDDKDEDSKIIKTLQGNGKWKWLTKSSEAYLDKTMKRVNKLIEEEVTRQVTHLVKFHMPSKNDEQTETEENPNNKEENITKNDKNNINQNNNDDSDSKSDEKTSRKAKKELEETKDEISGKKRKDKGKDKNKQKHKNKEEHKHEDENKHDHDNEDKGKKQAKRVKISATNTYGTSINNGKVTNIFIFALNGTDFKHLKPISNGNGIFIFGTDNKDNDKNIDSDTQTTEPSKVTDNSNTDSKPAEDKVEITTANPIKEEEVIDSTDSQSNKEDKPEENSGKPEDNSEKSEENSEKPEENSEKSEENSEKPEENSEISEENSEKPEENSEISEENSEKAEENSENPEVDPVATSEENQTEDSAKSEKNSENADTKDTQNKDKDLKDDKTVEIDERIGEVDEPKDKELKDSNENEKDKESNVTTTEKSNDK